MVAHRDFKSWTDLLTLPALVLLAPSRGGQKHVLRQEGETRRRCLDWRSGSRADLWAPLPVRSSKDRGPPAQVDDSDILPRFGRRQGDHSHSGGCSPSGLCGAFCRTAPVRPTDDVRCFLSASFTPDPPWKTAWRWTLFGGSRWERPPRLMWTRFVRLSCRSLRLLVRAGLRAPSFARPRRAAPCFFRPASPTSL